jgi:hypothetical protein
LEPTIAAENVNTNVLKSQDPPTLFHLSKIPSIQLHLPFSKRQIDRMAGLVGCCAAASRGEGGNSCPRNCGLDIADEEGKLLLPHANMEKIG